VIHKYSFQKRAEVIDDYGNTKGDWEAVFEARGSRRFFKGREKVIAAAETSTQEVIIRVRNSANARMVASDWRAVDLRTGETYNIRGFEPTDDRMFIEFLAQSGATDG
jgi:head-tail adaptor